MKQVTKTLALTVLFGASAGLPCAAQTAISMTDGAGPFPPPGALDTAEAPMVRGDTANTVGGWTVDPFFTVSESVGSYLPAGLLDGIAAFKLNANVGVVLVNHELSGGNGYAYSLANGTQLTGARISSFLVTRSVDASGNATATIVRGRVAFDTVYDRFGQEVVDPAQVNETGNAIDGMSRFCSSQGIAKGTYGFVDNVYITGEENGTPFAPFGGTQWALDVRGRALWAAPALGRGAWENVTPLETGDPGTVALLMGDDTAGAPLYLYVGEKDAIGDGSFLDRNGLQVGKLYGWKADDGSLSPEDFNGFGASRSGTFVELTAQDAAQAGLAGYDSQGYANDATLQAEADTFGCFSFSRPEDLDTNPLDGTQAAFNSTGRGSLFPSDNWGTMYVVDVDFSDLSADLVILHDADDLAVPDSGVRSPDNLDWGGDGKIYAQEDRSTSPGSLFGAATGAEASIWQVDPVTRVYARIAEIDRSAVAPSGSTDSGAGDLGNWETSGVLDVTEVFATAPGERLLIATVQAHGVQDGPIGGNPLLDEGGQLVFLSRIGQP